MKKKVLQLIMSIFIILFFIFGIGPLMDNLPFIKPMITFIEDRNIDASALYYTEIEEFSEADIFMNNTMDYQPKKLLNNNKNN